MERWWVTHMEDFLKWDDVQTMMIQVVIVVMEVIDEEESIMVCIYEGQTSLDDHLAICSYKWENEKLQLELCVHEVFHTLGAIPKDGICMRKQEEKPKIYVSCKLNYANNLSL